jgi:hypothetical protein
MYELHPEIIAAFPVHFSSAKVVKEREFETFTARQFYLFIQFDSIIKIPVTQESIGPVIDLLLNGDKALSECYKIGVNQHEAALRWVGNDKDQTIDIHGLALSFFVSRESALCLDEGIIQPLIDFNLINQAISENLLHRLKQAFESSPPKLVVSPRSFFSSDVSNPHRKLSEQVKAAIIQSQISTVKKESSSRSYPGEGAINPAYENLSQVSYRLHLNEKRIWILRSNFQVAIGVKNAYQALWGYHGLHDIFDEKSYPYLNWEDRSGHPSLAMVEPESGYDGDVYYAGHFAQREGYLEVVDNSGRFDRSDLPHAQLQLLQSYVALQFQKAFGEQKIVFVPRQSRNTYDADYFELSGFYSDHNVLAGSVIRYEYDSGTIARILNDAKEVRPSFSKVQ